MDDVDLRALLKRAFELVTPNLRHYYRVVRKAQIVKSYASDGRYWADVQPLRNDEGVDATEPVIRHVEIPVIWAGPRRGVVCPPTVGSLCDLEYYDGDPHYPRISNFRWHKNRAPECEVDGFIIQHAPGCHIKIDAGKNIVTITPASMETHVGGNMSVRVDGNVDLTVGGMVSIRASGSIALSGAVIDLN